MEGERRGVGRLVSEIVGNDLSIEMGVQHQTSALQTNTGLCTPAVQIDPFPSLKNW